MLVATGRDRRAAGKSYTPSQNSKSARNITRMTSGPLTSIAEQLLADARLLDAYAEANGLDAVDFSKESLSDLPLDMEKTRYSIIDRAQNLRRLAQGPRDLLFELLNHHVPPKGDISYADLAAAICQDEILVRRMLRVAMMNRLFIETEDGHVSHSAASRILHAEPGAMDSSGFLLEEMFPAATKMITALNKYPNSGEPNETGFNIAFDTDRSFYLELEAHPERARRFGSAMRWMSQGGRFSNQHLARGYNWAELDRPDSVVVDIGGGHGAVSIALAKETKNISFVVQDLPVCATQGAERLDAALKDRVTFMPHDFFQTQPVVGADVYFFRYILHNWSDKYAEKILKAVIPSMKEGSRILCVEFLPGEESTTQWTKKQPYNMDMIQAIGWNSIERTGPDWKRLFQAVDTRLQYMGTVTPLGCSVSLIEARLESQPNGVH
ncbi:O-methyltransferase, family 2 [Akanthomyces lecanii RCEF 1005]|uniref:O-methyltransferase, family 2 n=1 Tax=Akanthomyces lecanii RCEF 1005 TaxID=1081108 RepID=A0A168FZ95_CORDF|nr:O-methyltransferase, family 2 [Akanthomyces lecanii RCEF 1005]